MKTATVNPIPAAIPVDNISFKPAPVGKSPRSNFLMAKAETKIPNGFPIAKPMKIAQKREAFSAP